MIDITTKLAEALREVVADADAYEKRSGKKLVGGWPTKAREALRLYEQAKPAEPYGWVLPTGHGYGFHKGPNPPVDGVGWKAAHLAAPVAQAEPMDMALCEAARVVLREGQLYRFRRVGDCETCAELSKQSLEAYGQPPKENQP